MRYVSILLLLVLGSDAAWAGYRVHKLRVTHYDERGKVAATETVLSTLDHLQYEHHHGGYRVMRAVLMDTWYCPGDTSRREYCPKPKSSNRGPASTEPKRSNIPRAYPPIQP